VLGSAIKCVLLWAVIAATDWEEMARQARERSEREEVAEGKEEQEQGAEEDAKCQTSALT
jgi:hypothetical protein